MLTAHSPKVLESANPPIAGATDDHEQTRNWVDSDQKLNPRHPPGLRVRAAGLSDQAATSAAIPAPIMCPANTQPKMTLERALPNPVTTTQTTQGPDPSMTFASARAARAQRNGVQTAISPACDLLVDARDLILVTGRWVQLVGSFQRTARLSAYLAWARRSRTSARVLL